MKRKYLGFLAVVLAGSVLLSGCAQLKEKFVPKKKEEQTNKKYISVREYDVHPNLELYTKRYIYWKNWHKELLDVLAHSNHKKTKVAVENDVSNLMDMQSMLVEEKAEGLQGYIDDMVKIEDQIKTEKVTMGNEVRIRRKLETIGREVRRYYSYNKVRGYIADDFRE